jgi:probable HAF family extracellular repeat protein
LTASERRHPCSAAFADAVGVAGFQPVLFSDGSVLDLGSLGGDEGEAYGINASGQIVGWSDNEFGDPHAFLYFDGVMHDLGVLPGGLWSWAWDVNSHGHVIGEAPSPQHEGFGVGVLFWQGGIYDLNDLIPADRGWTIEETSAINDAGQISAYGCNRITGQCHALRLDPRAAITEPGSLALLGFGLAALGFFRWRSRPVVVPSKAR